MRPALYASALVIGAATYGIAIDGVVAAAAGVLLESTPFLIASVWVGRMFNARCEWIALLGCGCGTGPSARSLPAAAAAWFVFGPVVAIARVAAAIAVGTILHKARRDAHSVDQTQPTLLGALESLLPSALLAGAVTQVLARIDFAHFTVVGELLAGLLLGSAAPCGIGAIAVASALHTRAPLAAAAYLCVAGIADVRTIGTRCAHQRREHDALSYAMLAVSLAIIVARHGGALVHPKFSVVLGVRAFVAAIFGLRYRRQRARFFAPAIVLLAALAGGAPPSCRATETTVGDLFPGERLSFTGRLTRDSGHDALVRFAITCCRADAAPIVIRLAAPLRFPAGAWVRANGFVIDRDGQLCLLPQTVARIDAPSDPFIYR